MSQRGNNHHADGHHPPGQMRARKKNWVRMTTRSMTANHFNLPYNGRQQRPEFINKTITTVSLRVDEAASCSEQPAQGGDIFARILNKKPKITKAEVVDPEFDIQYEEGEIEVVNEKIVQKVIQLEDEDEEEEVTEAVAGPSIVTDEVAGPSSSEIVQNSIPIHNITIELEDDESDIEILEVIQAPEARQQSTATPPINGRKRKSHDQVDVRQIPSEQQPDPLNKKQRQKLNRLLRKSTLEISKIVMSKREHSARFLNDKFSESCRASNQLKKAREWQVVKLHPPSEHVSKEITVCSYNVLCQKTIGWTDYLYRHLDSMPMYLSWEYRWKGLQQELPALNADIIGLQEVQADAFETCFSPLMSNNGYNCFYKQKYGMTQKPDGCALCYKRDIFEEVEYVPVQYFVSPSTILDRDNIGQILALRCKTTNEVIVVANTHLIFNCERGDIKLAQLAVLLANVENVVERYTETKRPSILLFGDFNIEPFSPIYKYIVNGQRYIEGVEVRTLSGQSLRTGGKLCTSSELLHPISNVGLDSKFLHKSATPKDGRIHHNFNFRSVYSHGRNRTNHREISTYHKDQASPDFIFYNTDGKKDSEPAETEQLKLLEVYRLPTVDDLKNLAPWPNQYAPSDHIPLLAKFRLTKVLSHSDL